MMIHFLNTLAAEKARLEIAITDAAGQPVGISRSGDAIDILAEDDGIGRLISLDLANARKIYNRLGKLLGAS